MKAVLISISPKWCELIASGEKTVEVRKTKPKLEPPFKVYVYMTMDKCPKFVYDEKLEKQSVFERAQNLANGRVIGEFVCDRIGYVRNYGDCVDIYDFIESCLSAYELIKYATDKNGVVVYPYGWHISDLVIYEKPKELSEFYRPSSSLDKLLKDRLWLTSEELDLRVKRPPQSWCYVEEQK